jgi:hypothetical protein
LYPPGDLFYAPVRLELSIRRVTLLLSVSFAAFFQPWHSACAVTFDTVLEASGVTVYHHKGSEALAGRVIRVIANARDPVSHYLGAQIDSLRVYIYESNRDMANGLKEILDYQPWEVRAVVRVGISASTQGTLHIHSRAATMGPLLSHILVDEYVHGVIEKRFGPRPATMANWIEEGVTSYVAYEVLVERQRELEEWFLSWSTKVAFKAILFGRFPDFSDIARREQWYAGITAGLDKWQTQYAVAYMGMLYIVDQHGFHQVERLLSAIQEGMAYPDALKSVLDLSSPQFERQVQLWLLNKGFLEIYLGYTTIATILLVVFVATLIFLQRRVWTVRPATLSDHDD